MQIIIDFLSSHSYVVSAGVFVAWCILSFVMFRRTGDIKYIKEMREEMKYRMPNYRESTEVKGQEFEHIKPVYRLNKQTGELEETEEKFDIKAFIQSSIDTALANALNRLMPAQNIDEVAETYDIMLDDLDLRTQYIDIAENYRDKYGLSDDMSIEDIYRYVGKEAERLKVEIEKASTMKKNLGGVKDETPQNVEKSEPQEF